MKKKSCKFEFAKRASTSAQTFGELDKATTDVIKDLAENHLQVSLNKTVVEKWPRFWDMVLNENDVKVIRELKSAIHQSVSAH